MSEHQEVIVLRKGSRKFRSLKFWDVVAANFYDALVLGKLAPSEIKKFLEYEDKKLYEILDSLVKNNEEFIFVEVGSGTGRYIVSLAEKILTNPNYNRLLKYVIGLDFSWQMIKTCIDNLTLKKPRRLQIEGELLAEIESLWLKHGLQKQIKNEILKRVILVNCDATKPTLRIKGIKVVVAIMFGTLGNITSDSERKNLIQQVKQISDDVTIIATGFLREKHSVGHKIYSKLADRGFTPLRKITWDGDTFTAKETSEEGDKLFFYSKWFDQNEFEEILSVDSKHLSRIKIELISDYGFFGIVETKSIFRLPTFLQKKNKKINVELRCPKCGNPIIHLPLTKYQKIKDSDVKYKVETFRGFYVPMMLSGEKINPT